MPLFVFPFLLSSAWAGPVALLALDGRGVDAATAESATDALRDALVADGRLEVEMAAPIAEALGAGHESDLRKARERYASGRKAWDQADTSAAIAGLTEAIRLHDLAGSAWIRRGELADAHWLLGLCLLRDGRVLDGRAQLVEVARLWPGYAGTRGTGSSVAMRMFAEVEAGLSREEWAPPADEAIEDLFGVLASEWLAVGVVDATGRVDLRLFGRDGAVESVDGLVALPVDTIDESWNALAAGVARATGDAGGKSGVPVVGRSTGGSAGRDDGDLGEDDLDVEPDEYADEEDGDAAVIAPVGSDDSARPREVRIRERGSIRYDDRPVTARWWFWTGMVAVAGGVTATAIVLAQPPEVVEVQDDDAWSVVVDPS